MKYNDANRHSTENEDRRPESDIGSDRNKVLFLLSLSVTHRERREVAPFETASGGSDIKVRQ